MYLSILALPLLSAFLSVNRKCGHIGGPILSTIVMIFTALLGTIAWIEVGYGGSPVSLVITSWIETSNLLNIEWALQFDSLTAAMLIPVLYISALVQLFSLGYMSADPHRSRFFSYLSIFTFFMLILITGENLLVLFVGWEGVGLASYLLINFWYTRIAANMAAMKAFLLNRVGDWALTLGIIITICVIGDLSFSSILSMGLYINSDIIFIMAILFLIGASAKSAQVTPLGLNSWLANAMEGPTPVSALIHAATMVTAGIYLLMRLSPLLEWSSNSLLLVTWVGGISALLGAACGLLENDIKRVIAFSTTSQLGYMVIACGLSQYNIALFHLINHAFFKALLFLSAGAVIHAVLDQQDMRKMGGLILFLPFSYIGIFLGSLSLMAFPFMTGFYSKDLLLELALIPKNYTRSIAYIFAIMAAFLSAIYSVRLLIMTFLSKPNFPNTLVWNKAIEDPSFTMFIPLIFLSLGAVFFGYLSSDLFYSFTIFNNSIFSHPSNISPLEGSMIPLNSISFITVLKYLPLLTLFILISILPFSNRSKNHSVSLFYNFDNNRNENIIPNSTKTLLNNVLVKLDNNTSSIEVDTISPINKSNNNIIPNSSDKTNWSILLYSSQSLNFFNIINHWIIFNFLKFSNYILRYWDRGIVEIFGPYGSVRITSYLSNKISSLATSNLINYAFQINSFIFLFIISSFINIEIYLFIFILFFINSNKSLYNLVSFIRLMIIEFFRVLRLTY